MLEVLLVFTALVKLFLDRDTDNSMTIYSVVESILLPHANSQISVLMVTSCMMIFLSPSSVI